MSILIFIKQVFAVLLLEFRVTVVLTAISFRSALTFREAVVKGDKMIHLKINTHIKVQLNCSLSVIYCKCYFAFLVPVITITVIVMKPHDFVRTCTRGRKVCMGEKLTMHS